MSTTMIPLQDLLPAGPNGPPGRARVDHDDSDVESIMAPSVPEFQSMEPKPESPLYIVICLAILVFIVQLGASLSDVPSVQILEDIICYKFYEGIPTAKYIKENCLVGPVQSELNIISMGSLLFGYLPGILVAVHYGALADRRGRKEVLFSCIGGMIMSQFLWFGIAWNWKAWDLRYVWASSLPLLIGGGESVAEAIVFAIVADVAPEEKRATYFQIEICAVLLAEAIAPFIAKLMMQRSVWVPVVLSPAIMAFGCLLIFLIPETLNTRQNITYRSLRPAHPTFSTRVQRYIAHNIEPTSRWSRFRDSCFSMIDLLKTRDVVLLLPGASLMIPVATITLGITLRYLPIRFGWTLTGTGIILGVRTGINIAVLLIILPVLAGAALSKYDNQDRDLILARTSAVFLVTGQVVFASAQNDTAALLGLYIFTLGTGVPSLCRAALTRAMGNPQSVGRVFGLVAVCEMLGYLLSGLGFGLLFQQGLAVGLESDGKLSFNGRLFMSLTFAAAAIIYLWGCACLWLVKLGGQGADVESLYSDDSGRDVLHETRVLADGRLTRKHPSLEDAGVAI
ncbi:hypothetical protein VP1G_08216 [Cytospora mali]|uniref:Major facilitator superfamily (MFS) profile domain-containing protein n=1 Tax=Cytospora mali TaxID=578113 RepID=A0A194VAK3_CYTMA|nr:hypothetical protein VP1G_08216 [Valsa mali var. pyri (nom. inval.)]